MMYRPGDRVRFETTGDDGWPLIRYGFVGGVAGNGGRDVHHPIPGTQRDHPRSRTLLTVPLGSRFRDTWKQATTLDRHNELAVDVWTFRRGRYLHMGGSCRGGGVPCPDRSPFR